MDYRPRRAGKRWMEDAPEYILDVFRFPHTWIVLLGGTMLDPELLEARKVYCLELNECPTSPNMGVSLSGEWNTWFRPSWRRIKWLDLPEEVRRHICARVEAE